ncbi:MAG: phage terminase small subunit P27 family [Gammaproteobacteria bacterium]
MGKRGPAQRPTTLKLLHGEKNKDRLNPNEPLPRPTLPELPGDASPDVQKVWQRRLAELESMELAYSADSDALRCYCEVVIIHRKASKALAVSGVLVKGLHGNLVRNPALQIQRDAAQTIRAFAQEFGLTPSARSSVRAVKAGGASSDEDANPFAG